MAVKLPELIRWASIVLCAAFALSFTLFAWDELGSASAEQSSSAAGDRVKTVERDAHGRPIAEVPAKWRYELDRFSDRLTAPGESAARHLSANPSPWALRGLSLVFGILVFGIALRFVASWLIGTSPARQRRGGSTGGFTPRFR